MNEPPIPQGDYVPAVVHGGLAVSAGMTPRVDGVLVARGVIGADLDLDAARAAARIAAANAVTAIGAERIVRCLRLTVYLACAPGFEQHSTVADAASAVLRERLGERGISARSAIGVAGLPGGAPVEVELTAAVR